MVAMTTARRVLVVPITVLFTLSVFQDFTRVCASTITVPDFGFSKSSLEFTHVTTQLEWAKAADVCAKDFGGTLVRVNNLEERDALFEFTNKESVANHFWVGMQWSNGEKMWNDGSCTPVNTDWDHYKDAANSVFISNKQCFAAHDETVLEWEAFKCVDRKHFVCQRRADITTAAVNMDFHVIIQNNSDKAVCASLCKTLDQCFLSSSIQGACIVGLASNEPNTDVINVGPLPGQTITEAVTSGAGAAMTPQGCTEGNVGTPQPVTHLTNFTIINGYWQDLDGEEATPPACPSASPLVSHVYVTQTVTDTSILVSTTTTPVDVNTCITGGVVIQPTTVVQVMTSVVIETTTIPSYVTVTPLVGATSCGEYSTATYTTTVNSCDTVSVLSGSMSGTSSEGLGVSSDSTAAISSGLSEQFRLEVEALLLNKDELSKTLRTKNSAENKLTSSVAIGFSFSLMCVIFIAVIILSDMRAILYHLKTRMWTNLRSLSRSY